MYIFVPNVNYMFTWKVAIKRPKVSQYCKSLPKLMLGVKKTCTFKFQVSSPLRDVSLGGTSATQQQKFHTDDVNQCLHNKFGSHGVPDANLFNFTFLLVDFGKVFCWSAHELQQNSNASSREDYIPQILTVLLEILRVYLWPLWPFVFCVSFVNNS